MVIRSVFAPTVIRKHFLQHNALSTPGSCLISVPPNKWVFSAIQPRTPPFKNPCPSLLASVALPASPSSLQEPQPLGLLYSSFSTRAPLLHPMVPSMTMAPIFFILHSQPWWFVLLGEQRNKLKIRLRGLFVWFKVATQQGKPFRLEACTMMGVPVGDLGPGFNPFN